MHGLINLHPLTACMCGIRLCTSVVAGQLNQANAQHVLETLTRAGQGCLDGVFSAMVTAPVHKGIINDAGVPFSGHTEFYKR